MVKCGGLTEALRIKALAETWDLPVMPHMTQPSVGNAASLHLSATIPLASRPHEYTGPRPDLDELFTDPWELHDGSMTIPHRPGLGLTVNERGLERARAGPAVSRVPRKPGGREHTQASGGQISGIASRLLPR